MKLTQEQLAVLNSTADVTIVNAFAGAGKSTVLREVAIASGTIGEKGLFLAFNKAIADNLKKDFSEYWDCRTTHSHGLKELEKTGLLPFSTNNKAKLRGLQPQAIAAIENSSKSVGCLDLDFIQENYTWDVFKEIVDYTANMRPNIISFDDQLALHHINDFSAHYTKYDVVVVDEFQDITLTQLNFILKIPTKRIIFVGDPQQNIYQFAGSLNFLDARIKNHYKKLGKTISSLHLTESFRCSKSVAAFINKDLQLPKVFTSVSPKHPEIPTQVVPYDLDKLARFVEGIPIDKTIAILFRTNKKLLEVSSKLKKQFRFTDYTINGKRSRTRTPKGYTKEDMRIQDHLSIMTLHKAKGLEFDYVVVVPEARMFKEYKWKSPNNPEHNLMYVGVSRARVCTKVLNPN